VEKFGLYYDIFDRKVGKYEGKITFCGRNRQKHDKNMNDRDIFPQCGIMRVACPVLPGNNGKIYGTDSRFGRDMKERRYGS